MKKQNNTYKFFDTTFSVLDNRPGLICSPVLYEKQKNTSFFSKKKKYLEIVVQVNEKEIAPHCKIDLIHQALACLEKNPQKKKLLDVLQSYTKPLEKPFDTALFVANTVRFTSPIYGAVASYVTINFILVPNVLFLGTGSLFALMTVGFIGLGLMGAGIIAGITYIICKKLNQQSLNGQYPQHLESLLQAMCVNEEADVEKRIAPKFSEHRLPSQQTIKKLHFFSFNTNDKIMPNNEETSETVKVLSAYQAVI